MMRQASSRFSNDVRYRDDSHPAQVQLTPGYVLEPVRTDLGGKIALDPCTTPDNPVGAADFICPPADGAGTPWEADTIFVNPPYSRARERWVSRCIDAASAGSQVILLIPADEENENQEPAPQPYYVSFGFTDDQVARGEDFGGYDFPNLRRDR
jgi:DNA N-6-adenine-methyltransferase (Dam)